MVSLTVVTGFSLLLPLATSLYIFLTSKQEYLTTYAVILSSSLFAYWATTSLIPVVKEFTLKAGLSGRDINKKGEKEGEVPVPESLGIVPGTIFILVNMIALTYTRFYLPKESFIEHLSALTSITFCIFLGFSDDVLDLRWRYKIILPTIASIPLLLAYTGPTTILVPVPLRFIFGSLIDLGFVYFVYMGMLAVFCTNAINIYAGINGLEVGQSVIIGCFIAIHNAIEVYNRDSREHFFSFMIMIPFIFCSIGLLKFNKYPSQVFVGDTYCYFAGMTFAVCGILAHFSKALLLFFIPQLINFVLSIPQLIGIIPCPRHRLPRYDSATKKVVGKPENWNLLNVYLRIVGPQTEKETTNQLMIFQVVCNLAALAAIHTLPNILF